MVVAKLVNLNENKLAKALWVIDTYNYALADRGAPIRHGNRSWSCERQRMEELDNLERMVRSSVCGQAVGDVANGFSRLPKKRST